MIDSPAQPPEFTALGRAWCASALPLMALVLAALAASTIYAPGLVVILGIAFLAIPFGCALSLHRCQQAARVGPLTGWDVVGRFLWTGAVFGLAIPTTIAAVLALVALVAAVGSSQWSTLLFAVLWMLLVGMLGAAIGLVIALPIAWLAGWIASRTGFRPAAPETHAPLAGPSPRNR